MIMAARRSLEKARVLAVLSHGTARYKQITRADLDTPPPLNSLKTTSNALDSFKSTPTLELIN